MYVLGQGVASMAPVMGGLGGPHFAFNSIQYIYLNDVFFGALLLTEFIKMLFLRSSSLREPEIRFSR